MPVHSLNTLLLYFYCPIVSCKNGKKSSIRFSDRLIMPRRLDLFPDLIGKDWWHATNYPRQLLNQKFATVLVDEDLSNSDVHKHKGFKVRPRMPVSVKASGTSEVKIDGNGFQVTLDIEDFELGELSVERNESYIEVCGQQAEKRDNYGLVSREFTRRYMIPSDCDAKAVASSFTDDGKLIIMVPKGNKEIQAHNSVVVALKDTSSQKSITNQQDNNGKEKGSFLDESDPGIKEKSSVV